LPHHFYEEGVRRYGFHGLSYEFISEELKRVAPMHAAGRVVVAHLGNGASMAAIQDGKSIGSTMGFSALDGLPMGTRCGQIDPGVLLYLMQEKGMNADEISDLLYKQSGLKGMSGVSNDMRELEASSDPRADQAIDYFVFRIRRELGGLTAVLGGIDALIFTGGIGENSARNKAGETIISNEVSRARIMVLRTNEEAMIARHTRAHLG
jgi:acetate kinase